MALAYAGLGGRLVGAQARRAPPANPDQLKFRGMHGILMHRILKTRHVRNPSFRGGVPGTQREDRKMRTILLAGLLAGAYLILVSGPALACRGTTEYPDTAKKIEQSTLSPERKKELLGQLGRGDAMHKEAHRKGDMALMGEAIRILDGIKTQIGN